MRSRFATLAASAVLVAGLASCGGQSPADKFRARCEKIAQKSFCDRVADSIQKRLDNGQTLPHIPTIPKIQP